MAHHVIAGSNSSANLTVTEFLTFGLLATVPLVNVFAPSPWLPPPMMVGLALLFWSLRCGALRVDGTYLALCALTALSIAPWSISAEYVSAKTLLHALALLTSVTVYYCAAKSGLMSVLAGRSVVRIFGTAYFALLTTSAFILVEVLGINGRIFDITQFVPYAVQSDFEAVVIGSIHRPRGFASEPGVMALYYDVGLFVVLPLLRRGAMWKLGYFAVIVPAYLALLSTGSFIAVAFALAALTIWQLRTRVFGALSRAALVCSLVAATYLLAGPALETVFTGQVATRVGSLISGNGADVSATERRGRLTEVVSVVSHYPFGIGLGITAGLSSVAHKYRGLTLSEGQISLLGTFLVAGGLAAGALLAALLGLAIARTLYLPVYGPYLSAAGIAITIHQLTVTEFWLPFLWVYLALANSYADSFLDTSPATSTTSE